MSFILRAAFWLTVLAFLLPAAGDETATASAGGFTAASLGAPSNPAAAEMGAGEALTMAARSAQDVMGFCGRNPDVCARSHEIVGHVIRQTTHYGGMALVWLTDKAREQQQDSAPSPVAPISRQALVPPHLAGA
jgi:hypothetical protein